MKGKIGRPSKFTIELAEKICRTVAVSPYALKTICSENPDFPDQETIRVWRLDDIQGFSGMYAKAKLQQADILAEHCLEIADDASKDIKLTKEGDEIFNGEFAARSRLRIDTRKWLASKLLPKQYGDKIMLEQKTEENEALKQELIVLREKLDAQNKRDY